MASSETPRSIPWYKRFRDEFTKASKYIHVAGQRYIKRETLSNFDKETLAHFIFESNNIEKEGLPLGETRELVILGLEKSPELVESNAEQQQEINELFNVLQDMKKDLPIDFAILHNSILNKDEFKSNEVKLGEAGYKLIAKYGKKNKEADKVFQYLKATRRVDFDAIEFRLVYYKERLFSNVQVGLKGESRKKRQNAQELLKKIFADVPSNLGSLITEERIKLLHEIMATGFVNEKNAKAGHYRTKPIMTDMDSHYPAPEDVPAAMANFIKKYQEFESKNLNPIALASWASTQFVLIHPFSDFNGRMSRLLMNMIFRAYGVPFWVSLSSSGKERKKYIAALRQAREGNYLWIATLISIQLNKGFHELNKMLDLSGYDQIEIDDSNEFPPEQSDKEILFTFLKNE